MVQCFHVDGLNFCFDDDWMVGKYDICAFYSNRFSRMFDGIKAIDLLAISPDGTVYLIEATYYRAAQQCPRPSELVEEFGRKVFSTLAALLPAQLNADVENERKLATKALQTSRLRIVLHLEQKQKRSRLFPRAFDPANVQQKLKQRLNAVDATPLVTETTRMQGLPWMVEFNPIPAACSACGEGAGQTGLG